MMRYCPWCWQRSWPAAPPAAFRDPIEGFKPRHILIQRGVVKAVIIAGRQGYEAAVPLPARTAVLLLDNLQECGLA